MRKAFLLPILLLSTTQLFAQNPFAEKFETWHDSTIRYWYSITNYVDVPVELPRKWTFNRIVYGMTSSPTVVPQKIQNEDDGLYALSIRTVRSIEGEIGTSASKTFRTPADYGDILGVDVQIPLLEITDTGYAMIEIWEYYQGDRALAGSWKAESNSLPSLWVNIPLDKQFAQPDSIRMTVSANTISTGLWNYGSVKIGVDNFTPYYALGIRKTSQPYTALVYPNPADEYAYVRTSRGGQSYSLYSPAGTLLEQGTLTIGNTLLRLDHLPSGSYIVKVSSADQPSEYHTLVK